MSDENYILLESFQIDDGELDGLSPQECFVLGVRASNNLAQSRDSARGVFTDSAFGQ